MQRIDAIIRLESLEAVKQAFRDVGHHGMTVTEVMGHGIQGGIRQRWRGEDYEVDLLPKVQVSAVVHDHEATECVDALVHAARTGRMGDGKIFVSPVTQAIRVRTGESGTEAL